MQVPTIHEMRSEGKDFEPDPRMRKYLEKRVGLTDKQIERVLALSRRLLHSAQKPDRKR